MNHFAIYDTNAERFKPEFTATDTAELTSRFAYLLRQLIVYHADVEIDPEHLEDAALLDAYGYTVQAIDKAQYDRMTQQHAEWTTKTDAAG